jgi:hypothetical protein
MITKAQARALKFIRKYSPFYTIAIGLSNRKMIDWRGSFEWGFWSKSRKGRSALAEYEAKHGEVR